MDFPQQAIQDLSDLSANNNRDWFAANKVTLDSQLMAPALPLCQDLEAFLQELTGTKHARKLYRMHRDLRFNADKTPYNTHLHMSFLGPPGTCAWHLGIDTKSVSVGAGVFELGPDQLISFCTRVASGSGEAIWRSLTELTSAGVRLAEPELRLMPSGYPADQLYSDLFRRKGLSAWVDIGPAVEATKADFAWCCKDGFWSLNPIADVINRL